MFRLPPWHGDRFIPAARVMEKAKESQVSGSFLPIFRD